MYIRVPTQQALGEPLGQIDDGPSAISVTSTSTATTPSLDAMTCRLLCASMLAYAPAARLAAPYYEKVEDLLYYTKAGFLDRPTQIQGKKVIDACLIGTMQGPSPTQKSIVLAFRGTVGNWATDWLNDLEVPLVPFARIPGPGVLVHKGFIDSIESFYGKGIVKEIQSRLKSNPGAQLYITGHSKGGALAYLAALLLARRHRDIPVAGVITFEAPRAGHPNFVEAYNSTGIESLRYEFQNDIVPHVPPAGIFAASLAGLLKKSPAVAAALSVLYPKAAFSLAFKHAGRLRFINWNGNIVDDYSGLEAERSARLTVLLLELVALGGPILARLPILHSISCGSGSWRAICKTEGCQ